MSIRLTDEQAEANLSSQTYSARTKRRLLAKYAFEFASVFLAVFLAFALNNYASDKRDRIAENRIINDIAEGLRKDSKDLQENVSGHEIGIRAAQYFRQLALGEAVDPDSFSLFHFLVLRDFINQQNTAGYENLKSRGLEIVRDDTLRNLIVSLYEYDYTLIRKLEEEYQENQFFATYGTQFDQIIAPYIEFLGEGNKMRYQPGPSLSATDQQNLFMILYRIQLGRQFTLRFYETVEQSIERVLERIEESQEE